jgi:nucleoid-associated protein YgaU
MTRLPGSTPPEVDETAAPNQLASPDPHAPAPADAANEPASRSAEPWTVAAGDSFWSIAEEVLTDIAGREPTDQAIRRYWLQLIETNRRRLADPANPDLLIPGQRLALPDPQ